MGPTDQFDAHIHQYTICTPYKNNKWITRIIESYKDFEFQNTFLLYNLHSGTPKKRTDFYYHLCHDLLSKPVIEVEPEIPYYRRLRKRTAVSTVATPRKKTCLTRSKSVKPCQFCKTDNIRTRTAFQCS